LFSWKDFRKIEKIREKSGENYFCGCLVGEMRGRKIGGTYWPIWTEGE